MAVQNLTTKRLRELLDFDQAAGVYTRKIHRKGFRVGEVAGCKTPYGYICIRVDGTLYLAHRLAWLYVYGEWPPHQIDHINGIRHDNRIANLRLATTGENGQNRRGARCDSLSGVLGVSQRKGDRRWVATLKLNGKRVHRSYHKTRQAAEAAYLAAKAKFHPFAPIRSESARSSAR